MLGIFLAELLEISVVVGEDDSLVLAGKCEDREVISPAAEFINRIVSRGVVYEATVPEG